MKIFLNITLLGAITISATMRFDDPPLMTSDIDTVSQSDTIQIVRTESSITLIAE